MARCEGEGGDVSFLQDLRAMLSWWKCYRQDLERPWTIVTDRGEGRTITKWSSTEWWPETQRIFVPCGVVAREFNLNEPPLEMEFEWQYLAGYDRTARGAVYRRIQEKK